MKGAQRSTARAEQPREGMERTGRIETGARRIEKEKKRRGPGETDHRCDLKDRLGFCVHGQPFYGRGISNGARPALWPAGQRPY